jgi:hypothetical protein
VCSACGRILVPEEMTWVKPWWNTREALVPAGILADLSGSRARTV